MQQANWLVPLWGSSRKGSWGYLLSACSETMAAPNPGGQATTTLTLTPHTVLLLQGFQSPEHLYRQSHCLDAITPPQTVSHREPSSSYPKQSHSHCPHASLQQWPRTPTKAETGCLEIPVSISTEPCFSQGKEAETKEN